MPHVLLGYLLILLLVEAPGGDAELLAWIVHPAAARCDMVLHKAFRARSVRKTGIGGEVRHVVTSGVS